MSNRYCKFNMDLVGRLSAEVEVESCPIGTLPHVKDAITKGPFCTSSCPPLDVSVCTYNNS